MNRMRPRTGLTLIEVMIAMLILGSGLVAVASLFPVAGTIQRRSYDEVVVRQVGDSVTSLIDARGFNTIDMIDPLNPTALLLNKVTVMPPRVLGTDANNPTPAIVKWGLLDRSYPTAMGNDPNAENRSFYWVPLVRRANLVDWHIYVFVLKKEPGVNYGSHVGSANPGDPVSVPRVVSVPVISTTAIDNEGSGPLGKGKGLGLNTDLGWGNNEDEIEELLDTHGAGVDSSVLVLSVENQFQMGDWVLDSQGVAHRVLEANGFLVHLDGYVNPLVTELWYSPRPAGISDSPTRRILTFGNGVILK